MICSLRCCFLRGKILLVVWATDWSVCADAAGRKDQESSENVDGRVQSGGDDRVDVGPSVRQKSPPVQGLPSIVYLMLLEISTNKF